MKFNCSETDHLRSGEETIRVLLETNYAKLACRDVESDRIVGCSAQQSLKGPPMPCGCYLVVTILTHEP